jgi:hypothetical protein
MYMITATEANLDFNTLTGLIDVNLVVASQVSATSVTVEATFDYGTALNPILLQGVTSTSDWEIFDVTNQLSLGSPTGVSESPAGTYTLLKAFTPGDDYTVSVVKDGFTGSVTFTAA